MAGQPAIGKGKALDAIDDGPSESGERAEDAAEKTREAGIETAVFNERLREAATAQENLAKSTEAAIAALRQQARDAKEVADAQKALDLERLDLAKKFGQRTPDQAVMIPLQIDETALKREQDAKKAEIQAEQSARQQGWQAKQDRERANWAAREQADAAALAGRSAETKNEDKLNQAGGWEITERNAAREARPQAAMEASASAANAKSLINSLQAGEEMSAHLAEINETLALGAGLLESHARELDSHRSDLQDIHAQIEGLLANRRM